MSTPELVMGDAGMLHDSEVGIKLATIRAFKPGKYQGIEKGLKFDAIHKEKRVPSTCLYAAKGLPVAEYAPELLMFDGYIDSKTAAKSLAEYYDGFDKTTPSALIVFATEKLIDKIYPTKEQTLPLWLGDIGDAVRRPENVELFHPSWAFWFTSQYGNSINLWYEWMNANGLLSSEQKDFISKWKKGHKAEYEVLSKSGRANYLVTNFFKTNRKLTPTFERAILLREPTPKK